MATLQELEHRAAKLERTINDALEASHGEETDEIAAIMQEAVNADLDFDNKLEACGIVLDRMKREADRLKDRADMYKKAAAAQKREHERFRKYILYVLQQRDIRKVEGDYPVTVVQNRDPELLIDEGVNLDDIPERFIRRGKPSINRVEVREALVNGEDLPWARLGETPFHLRMR